MTIWLAIFGPVVLLPISFGLLIFLGFDVSILLQAFSAGFVQLQEYFNVFLYISMMSTFGLLVWLYWQEMLAWLVELVNMVIYAVNT